MKLLRMAPGKGDVLLAEGDPAVEEDAERLIEEFRRQLDLGMWAAVPLPGEAGRHEATMVRDFAEIPVDAERIIFFPQAAGGDAVPAEEVRARELLRSVVGEREAEMYEELGLLAVENPDLEYGYLIYPHRPLVGYDARTGKLLSEYCVKFRDGSDPDAGERLPDADDVLAKWMALRADEREVLATANVHPLGRQLDPQMVKRDLEAVTAWKESE